MFPRAAAGASNTRAARATGHGFGPAAGSRVAGCARGASASCRSAVLAEEIETPGEGQIRALITIAGNPVLSTPERRAARRGRSSRSTSWSSVDIYLNETTRHADVILPAPSPLERAHYDLALYQLAVRNVANYSPPVLDADAATSRPTSGARCCAWPASRGAGPDRDIEALDALVAPSSCAARRAMPRSPLAGRDAEEVLDRSSSRASAPSASSTSCCAPPTATLRRSTLA